ncbi:MAG: hypothetical protein QF476_08955 [Dehalococcoidia bacterium]|nr:hypothetical protein [Dehalococcoidia bacterium]
MSIISERLTKLGHTERSGFGFGARAASIKTPVILVGATIDKPGDAKGVNADLFVLTTGKKGASQKIGLKDTELWGVLVAGGTGKEIDAAIEAGADFVVSEGESAPGAALRDDESGKGFVVGTDVSEDRSKAIDAGPFDFLILDGTAIEFPLSVGAVLDIQEKLVRYSHHIFLRMSDFPDQENLELLRDIGISALMYDTKTADASNLKSLRDAIDKLEPKKQKNSAEAVLPKSGESTSGDDDYDDQGHDQDEEWEYGYNERSQ